MIKESILDEAQASTGITQNDMSFDVHHQGTGQIINDQKNTYQLELPNLNYESVRQSTLSSLINMHVPREKLARYGFFDNFDGDHVKCYFCKVVIGKWGVGDDPLTEHHIHSPECEFINMKQTGNVPIGDELSLRNELKAILESHETGSCGATGFNANLIPRHPGHKEEKTRLESFKNWPKSLRQSTRDLSVAGFFYLGVGDKVKCFFCGGVLKDWEDIDMPLEEHKKHFYDQCNFIRKNYLTLKRNHSNQYSKNLVRATPTQIEKLTKYMNEHPDLKDGKINPVSNKLFYNRLWGNLTEYLNNMEGPKKNPKAWKDVWRNYKYNNQRKSTVNSSLKLKKSEKKILHTCLEVYHYNPAASTSTSTITAHQ